MNGEPMSDEAGAAEDRLSLTPSKFPFTEDWQDGQTYTITAKVQQISPGEFQVMEATSPGADMPAEPGTEVQPEAEPNNEDEAPAAPPNPAVRGMMKSGSPRQMSKRGY